MCDKPRFLLTFFRFLRGWRGVENTTVLPTDSDIGRLEITNPYTRDELINMTSAKTRIDDGVLIIVSKIVKKYNGTTPEKARNDVKTKHDAFIRVLKPVNQYGNSSLPRSNITTGILTVHTTSSFASHQVVFTTLPTTTSI
jgi:hypothetical protein